MYDIYECIYILLATKQTAKSAFDERSTDYDSDSICVCVSVYMCVCTCIVFMITYVEKVKFRRWRHEEDWRKKTK